MMDPILILPEVAVLWKVAEKTVYAMALNRQIRAFKARDQGCFKHEDIDPWIDEQKASVMDSAGKGTLDV